MSRLRAAAKQAVDWPQQFERSMRIGIATNHGGFGLKEELVAQLRAAEFSQAERHLRRLGKVSSLEGTPDG